ncbi:hypothetical protein [Vibrio alginolyticus]|uniref:hypothetical protein n=1 Tax=Vibrio alginolyticus TaxID=663 RepID=UPI0021D14519
MKPEQIFTDKISESFFRLDASLHYLDAYNSSGALFELESSILQLRKALECVVFSNIAPNVEQYKKFRNEAKKGGFENDYHGKRILQALEKINPDFYPIPYEAPKLQADGNYISEQRLNKFPKKSFEKLYDRLGKYLHADNPWGNDKGYRNIAKEIPKEVEAIQDMMNRYISVVRGSDLNGAWLVERQSGSNQVTLFKAAADGEFTVNIKR